MHYLVEEFRERKAKILELKRQITALGGENQFEPPGIDKAYREEIAKITPKFQWSVISKGEYQLRSLTHGFLNNQKVSDTRHVTVQGLVLDRLLLNRDEFQKIADEFGKTYETIGDFSKNSKSAIYYVLPFDQSQKILMASGDGCYYFPVGILILNDEWSLMLDGLPPVSLCK